MFLVLPYSNRTSEDLRPTEIEFNDTSSSRHDNVLYIYIHMYSPIDNGKDVNR